MALPKVGPRDCALAVGIPTDRKSFLEALRSPQDHDFALMVKQQSESGSNQVLGDLAVWREYEPWARRVLRVCQAAEAFGVTVRTRAELSDLTELTACFPVVTLLTHCRFPPIGTDDLL